MRELAPPLQLPPIELLTLALPILVTLSTLYPPATPSGLCSATKGSAIASAFCRAWVSICSLLNRCDSGSLSFLALAVVLILSVTSAINLSLNCF